MESLMKPSRIILNEYRLEVAEELFETFINKKKLSTKTTLDNSKKVIKPQPEMNLIVFILVMISFG